jgi:hypothetical protein
VPDAAFPFACFPQLVCFSWNETWSFVFFLKEKGGVFLNLRYFPAFGFHLKGTAQAYGLPQ